METAIIAAFCALLLLCVLLGRSILYALAAGLVLFLLYGRHKGLSWQELGRLALSGVKTVRNILISFVLIGMLTALWRAADLCAGAAHGGRGAAVPPVLRLPRRRSPAGRDARRRGHPLDGAGRRHRLPLLVLFRHPPEDRPARPGQAVHRCPRAADHPLRRDALHEHRRRRGRLQPDPGHPADPSPLRPAGTRRRPPSSWRTPPSSSRPSSPGPSQARSRSRRSARRRPHCSSPATSI